MNFGRIESRIPAVLVVELNNPFKQILPEAAYTENVSPRGARLVTRRRWQPNDQLEVQSLSANLRCRARVTYCEMLPDDRFAIGLELLGSPAHWTANPN
jgi:hypothetical protein